MTVLGTRPEIIRLSRVIPLLDRHSDHVLVHTGQNYDARLSDVFFSELGVRAPDVRLDLPGGGIGAQLGGLLAQIEPVFRERRPERLLLLGDTNSALVAIIAKRLGIPVFHMEAGNRCYDDRVPEEVNRRVIDHCSSVLLPYTQNSKQNLLAEGIPAQRIFVTGNPIYECLQAYAPQIEASTVLADMGLAAREFFLATLHRAENVDRPERLLSLVLGLRALASQHGKPMVVSVHPRTRQRLAASGVNAGEELRLVEPLGFFDFVHLEQRAVCVLSDSGTVQEECAIFRTPTVTIRDVTERPETLEAGSNALAGASPEDLLRMAGVVLEVAPAWQAPPDYLVPNVAEVVVRIMLGHRVAGPAEAEWLAS